jgi:hypothetical protein
MNGLSSTTDLNFLIGRELLQVSFGLHQTILSFDSDTSISIECKFRLVLKGQPRKATNDTRSAGEFSKLLGCVIANAVNKGTGELGIEFSDGSFLELFDSNAGFESYQIAHGKNVIVV